MPRQLKATKTSHEKWIHIFFSLYRNYSDSPTLPNASELFWSWISISHIQVHKEKENFVIACMFTSFTKREIRHFPVVVVQWRQRNVHKIAMYVQSCCFALSRSCQGALTICMENSVIPGRIQMERFIPVEIFSRNKVIPFEVLGTGHYLSPGGGRRILD